MTQTLTPTSSDDKQELVEQLDLLISQMDEEERRYLKYVYAKIKDAEEKLVHVTDIYRNVEAELVANQSALDIWLSYVKKKYQPIPQENPLDDYQT
jgi:hypothetical protein